MPPRQGSDLLENESSHSGAPSDCLYSKIVHHNRCRNQENYQQRGSDIYPFPQQNTQPPSKIIIPLIISALETGILTGGCAISPVLVRWPIPELIKIKKNKILAIRTKISFYWILSINRPRICNSLHHTI